MLQPRIHGQKMPVGCPGYSSCSYQCVCLPSTDGKCCCFPLIDHCPKHLRLQQKSQKGAKLLFPQLWYFLSHLNSFRSYHAVLQAQCCSCVGLSWQACSGSGEAAGTCSKQFGSGLGTRRFLQSLEACLSFNYAFFSFSFFPCCWCRWLEYCMQFFCFRQMKTSVTVNIYQPCPSAIFLLLFYTDFYKWLPLKFPLK